LKEKRPIREYSASKAKKARGFVIAKAKMPKKLQSTICQSFGAETPLLQSKLVVL